jgi:hypothetical protein
VRSILLLVTLLAFRLLLHVVEASTSTSAPLEVWVHSK